MKLKNLAAVLLLLFVGSSVAILVGREMRHSTAAAGDDVLPDDVLVVYYFHGNTRCPTCQSIENFSHAAIESAFAEQLGHQEVLWKVVNYELPEHSHFVTDYDIVAPTVVLVRRAAGDTVEWRNLDRVWELIGDREAFTEYIQTETQSMLGS